MEAPGAPAGPGGLRLRQALGAEGASPLVIWMQGQSCTGSTNTPGPDWCIGARVPCPGCTEPSFPDGMTPFIKQEDGLHVIRARQRLPVDDSPSALPEDVELLDGGTSPTDLIDFLTDRRRLLACYFLRCVNA